jgi:type I restriction-modification system DNA methylase subunit
VIKFIWDRVGYTGEDGFYRFEDGGRRPRLVLDVATGSGGFLVEAANRLRTATKYSKTDPNEMLEVLACMMNGLWGCEISQFANYITEVNLLVQLTPLVRAIIDAYKGVPRDLSMVRLMTAPGDSLALVGAGPLFNPGNNHVVRDVNRELIPHDPKGRVRELLTSHFDYDYVCSNPPYVGEKGHKELFRSTLESLPYWRRHYQGKMDYLYWFVILGLIKLREGGRLGFITTSYWPTADGATHLREFILENALILEIIDFGETRIFEGAPGQHNMVFVLEKCPSYAPNASHILIRA